VITSGEVEKSSKPEAGFSDPSGDGEPAGKSRSRLDTLPSGFEERLRATAVEPGDLIGGRYLLIERLGSGAMGDVFVAENTAIGLKVAVKLLKPEMLANPEFRRRFQQEAMAVAAIQHPNVARFLDLVIDDPIFLVMEYVRGKTLSKLLRDEGRLPLPRAVAIAERLCWALDAAHAEGIVHRDLKPANVLITSDREAGEVPKLIDFGLAKIAISAPEERLTRAGQLIGTTHYMAPEQIAGKEVDVRSDVYSLGCVLFEMIAGRTPFEGDEDIQVLYQHINEPVPSARTFVPEVPATLEAVLMRAMAKQPEERFASMAEMARALVGSIERRQTPPDAARAAPRARWRWALAGMLTLALAILAGTRLPARRVAGGLLLLDSRPHGATVELDGRKLAETTPTVERGVPAGHHTIRMSLAEHAPAEQVVELDKDMRLLVDVALAAPTRTVQVQSMPSGAFVFVDGALAPGKTPLQLTLTRDDFHLLSIEHSGYAPARQTVKPDDEETMYSVRLVAERAPYGLLWVDASQIGQVFVDDADTGFTTPSIGLRLAVGEHQVELRSAVGKKLASKTVRIGEGDINHVYLEVAANQEARP
jgi:tRNA A-37 threonylcarbamoyl transferase component Bud32